MIKRRKKECKECKKQSYLFGKGLCTWCYRKQLKRPNPISKKQRSLINEYSPKARKFIEERPMCEARLPNCQGRSTEVHHKAFKHSRELYLNENYWLAVCRSCHNEIHGMGKEAYEKGFLIKK